MPAQYWLLLAAALALLCAQRQLRRALSQALMGRTRRWRLRAASDGSLRARGCRLRFYGVGEALDLRQAACCFDRLTSDQVRWRILSVDDDGTLAIVLRVEGRNVAVEMLRRGLIAVRGTGARRYRAAQAQARVERLGMWSDIDHWPMVSKERPNRFAPPFPWWQG